MYTWICVSSYRNVSVFVSDPCTHPLFTWTGSRVRLCVLFSWAWNVDATWYETGYFPRVSLDVIFSSNNQVKGSDYFFTESNFDRSNSRLVISSLLKNVTMSRWWWFASTSMIWTDDSLISWRDLSHKRIQFDDDSWFRYRGFKKRLIWSALKFWSLRL